MRRSSCFGLAMVLSIGAFSAAARAESAPAGPVLVDKIAAVVGEVTVFRSDVIAASRPLYAKVGDPEKNPAEIDQLHKDVLGRIIDDLLVARDAQRLKIEVHAIDVERAREWVAKQNNLSLEQLDAELKKQGVSKDEYDAELMRQLMVEKWVVMKVRPRIKLPIPSSPKAEDQAQFVRALDEERKKAVAELRSGTFVEVRW